VNRFVRIGALPLLLVAVLAAAGCSKELRVGGITNQLPEVTVTQAPRDSNVVCTPGGVASCYAITISWIGFDPDGSIDYYRYAVDPPSAAGADTVWETTRSSTVRLVLSASHELPTAPHAIPLARDFHVFVVQAVDNRGAAGPSETKAFFAYTQAPDVFITDPLPSNVSLPVLTPSVRISWSGSDDDGAFSRKPVKYKYTLLTQSTEYSVTRAFTAPDSLRMYFAPDFSTWDSVGGDTTSIQIRDLSPDQDYMFVVVGFDEAGAYSPVFQLTSNMLHFRVGFAGQLGPKITAFSEFFSYTWRSSYCATCPFNEFLLEMPAGKKSTISWTAEPAAGGADMQSYRWAIDIEDVADDTPRSDVDDVRHWSSPSLNNTTITIGPYAGSQEHRLYIEAADNLGLKSLAVIRILVIPPNFRPGSILIVKDTRYPLDNLDRVTGCAAKPRGAWPSAAELDTFLFARGGFPWRCYVPAVQSQAGIFNGYAFDTLGTRARKTDLTVRLSTLARYQHVIWITDFKGANTSSDGIDLNTLQTALRYMCSPLRFNSLSAYAKLGGKMWLLGSGAGLASTAPWDRSGNNQPVTTFSSALGELVPGRLMYDLAAWRSAFRSTGEAAVVRRYGGRYEGRPSDDAPYTRYVSELPARLEFKTSATDPLPPYRSAGDLFYASSLQLEYLIEPNAVIEDIDPDPDVIQLATTLDTLYDATGVPSAGSNPHNVVMTYAHGPSNPQGILFSGFDLWTFKRTQCKAVIDFVLRRMWNLSPTTLAGTTSSEDRSVAVPATVGMPRGPNSPSPAARGTGRAGVVRLRSGASPPAPARDAVSPQPR
jgi:hypothetical protein